MTSTLSTPLSSHYDDNAPQVAVNDIGSAEDFLAAVDADHQVLQRRRHRRRHHRQGRPRRGSARHRLQDRRRHPLARAFHQARRRSRRGRRRWRSRSRPWFSQKEDKEGRLILSKKRAQYERAWGDDREDQGGGRRRRPAPSSRSSRVASSSTSACAASCPRRSSRCAVSATCSRTSARQIEAKIIELDKNRNNVVLSRRAWLEQTQSEVRSRLPEPAAEGPGPQGRRVLDRQLRCVRGPGRRRRPRPRLRAVLEAHRPPVRGRRPSARRSPSRSSTWTWTASASPCR